ncbi:hypothetical protein IAI18_17350 [Acetobacteraceae bacterium H6797]|nr:hypothetical protein [Acetobacteraceae bacterium H6797]
MAEPVADEREEFVFGDYDGYFLPGEESEHLVVIFSGVGDPKAPVPTHDFRRSMLRQPQVGRIFLRDLKRSWYQNPNGRDALLRRIRQIYRGREFRALTLLGVSMGAYGALWFAQELRNARVVAMSPPPSLDLERHGAFMVHNRQWLLENQATAGTDLRIVGNPARYLILYGDESATDIANMRLMMQGGWPGLYVCPGAEHNIGSYLIQQGRLHDFAGRLCAREPFEAMAAAAGAYPAFDHCHSLQMLRARGHLYRGEMAEAGICLDDAKAAVGTRSPALTRLTLFARHLGDDPIVAAKEQGPPWPEAVMPLNAGAGLHLESASARYGGRIATLGPLARARLSLPEAEEGQTVTLHFEVETPPLQSGNVPLSVFTEEGAGWRLASRQETPAQPISLPLTIRGGQARFLLHCPRFYSDFDAQGTERSQLWAMKLRKVSLGRVEKKPRPSAMPDAHGQAAFSEGGQAPSSA